MLWVLLLVTSSLTAQLASAGLHERVKLMVMFLFGGIVTLLIFPFVVGWTLGQGFMFKLGLVDFSGCAAIHLVAGFSSFFGAAIIKGRLGRFEPLAIKRTVGDNEISLSHF